MKKRTALLVLSIILLSTTACNRGYGCPSNFSIEDGLSAAFQMLLLLF